jgi:hypothetical protein
MTWRLDFFSGKGKEGFAKNLNYRACFFSFFVHFVWAFGVLAPEVN